MSDIDLKFENSILLFIEKKHEELKDEISENNEKNQEL